MSQPFQKNRFVFLLWDIHHEQIIFETNSSRGPFHVFGVELQQWQRWRRSRFRYHVCGTLRAHQSFFSRIPLALSSWRAKSRCRCRLWVIRGPSVQFGQKLASLVKISFSWCSITNLRNLKSTDPLSLRFCFWNLVHWFGFVCCCVLKLRFSLGSAT